MDDTISLTSEGTSGVFVARPSRARGAMLIASYLMLSLVMVYYSAMTIRTANQRVSQETLHNRLVATELAHGAMAQLREDLFQFLSTEVHARRYQGDAVKTMAWLDKLNPKNPNPDPADPPDPQLDLPEDLTPGREIRGKGLRTNKRVVTLPTGTGQAWLSSINAMDPTAPLSPRDIVVRGQATVGSITQQTQAGSELQAGVRVEMGSSDIFNYAYFVNNYGWFSATGTSKVNIYGDIRANGDVAFLGGGADPHPNIKVDGDLIAAKNPELVNPQTGVPADGTISGIPSYDPTWLAYYNTKPDTARPARRVVAPDQPAITGAQTTVLPPGYGWDSDSPEPERNEGQSVKPIPYLGDLDIYKEMARNYNGGAGSSLTYLLSRRPPSMQTVTAVYYGPDGIPGTADDADPLVLDAGKMAVVIDGPIVVPGDVIIKGKIKGRGNIYAGRNVHIVGPVGYYGGPTTWDAVVRNTQDRSVKTRLQRPLGRVCDDGTYLPSSGGNCPGASGN